MKEETWIFWKKENHETKSYLTKETNMCASENKPFAPKGK